MQGVRARAFTLLRPVNHYASRLPNLPGALVYKLVTPRLAPARFAEYLIALPAQGISTTVQDGHEHFLFGLDGEIRIGADEDASVLGPRGFAYVPPGDGFVLHAAGAARFLWIKRPYERWPGLGDPPATAGDADQIPATETAVPGLLRRELLDPLNPAFDFNVSLMSFAPGVALHQIEIHDEEHGLYMTAGGGDYHLDGGQFPVSAEDFIYMAPYCPQGFRAGDEGGEYLLYKDVYRDGF